MAIFTSEKKLPRVCVFILLGAFTFLWQGRSGDAQITEGQKSISLDGENLKGILLDPKLTQSTLIAPHERNELSDESQAVAAGNNQFAIDIYRHLSRESDSEKNLLVSPFSISTALAMTYAGARERTARQMADVLHFRGTDHQLHRGYSELIADLDAKREGYELNITNQLFGQNNFPFKLPFLQSLRDHYQAPLEQLNYVVNPETARTQINEWVETQTNDRIIDLLPPGSVTTDTRLVLANTVYFDGDWKHKFDEQATRKQTFTSASGQSTDVSMMLQERAFNYAERESFKILEMPYAGDDLSMVVMLPDEFNGLDELEAALTTGMFDESLAALSNRKVSVKLPKFSFKDSFSLKDTLASLGMPDAFSDAADFSGIADANLQIDSVVHKTFIEVNEAGTEAAAATGVTIGTTSVFIPPSPTFHADHPFLFALRDTHSGSLLFMGRVTDPAILTAAETVPEPTTVTLATTIVLALTFQRVRQI